MASKKILKHGVPVRFGTYDTPPDNPENGMIYYDMAAGFFKVYENGSWQSLSSRNYAKSILAGFDIKGTCKAASVGNVEIAGGNVVFSKIGTGGVAGGGALWVAGLGDYERFQFTVPSGQTWTVGKITPYLRRNTNNYPSWPDTYLRIWTQSSGGSLLATSQAVPGLTLPATNPETQPIDYVFATPIVLTAGTYYFQVWEPTGAGGGDKYYYAYTSYWNANRTNYGINYVVYGAEPPSTIDGVSLTNGDRILLKNQTVASQNGIYVYSSSTLSRSADFSDGDMVNGGEFIFVTSGTENAASAFICTNSSSATIGTTAITFTTFTTPARTMQQHYAVGGQITTSGGKNVIVAGTEKLQIEAAGGLEITNFLSAGQTLVPTASVSGSANVGTGKLVIGSDGNITKLNNVTTSFPSSASMANYALANNGSGTLRFSTLAVSNLNDVTLTSISSGDLLRYSSKWLNSRAASFTGGEPAYLSSTGSPYFNLLNYSAGDYYPETYTHIGFKAPSTSIRKVTFQLLSGVYVSWRLFAAQQEGPSGNYFATGSVLATTGSVLPYQVSNRPHELLDVVFTFNPPVQVTKDAWYALVPSYTAGGSMRISQENNSPYITLGAKAVPGTYTNYNQDPYIIIEGGAESSSNLEVMTDASGFLGTTFLQNNLNLGNNIISGISTPSVSTDLATKAYVDAFSLQDLYNQDPDGSGVTITTTSTDGALIVAGTEKMQITASSGVSVVGELAADSMSAGNIIVGNASMSVSAAGNLAKIGGVSYSFPASQAAGDNYLMVNDGSGNLSWANFNFDQMSDTIVTDVSDFQMIRYDGTNFVNVNTVLSGGADQILRTDVSGHLASEALQYPIDFVGNTLTGVGMAVGSSDMVSKAYADANAIDTGINTINLNSAYHYGPVLTTNSTEGFLEITGSESLKVSASFALADSSDDTKFSKVFYKHGITLAANMTSAILNDLTFSSALYQGCVIEYRMKDNVSGDSRVGTLMLSTDGASTSISDTFAETAPMGVTWAATMAENDVQVLYTTNTSAKTLSAKIKFFA